MLYTFGFTLYTIGMGYGVALNKAWDELGKLNPQGDLTVSFLADDYIVDPSAKKIISKSTNAPAKDFNAIIILHYLAQTLKGLPDLSGEWLTFRELSGVEGYEAAFRKRCIEPIFRKYGNNPQGVFTNINKLNIEKAEGADAALIVKAMDGIPALVKVWKQDAEFGPDANILFDRSIMQIFCTEDIIVLAGMIASKL